MSTFLSLPEELIIEILLYLPPTSLQNCSLACRYLAKILRTSTLLRYHLSLVATSYDDNPRCRMSLSERLSALKEQAHAWTFFEPDFTSAISVNHHPSGIYDLSGGVYLLGNEDRRTLHWIELPIDKDQRLEWNSIHSPRTIIDMGLCVYEHDLLAIITTGPHEDGNEYDIELSLLQLSTGQPHPLAKKSTLLIITVGLEKPAIATEIVGDHLVLVLSFYSRRVILEDYVYVYNWRTGVPKASFNAAPNSYASLVFLTHDLFLLPNANECCLEIYRIGASPALEALEPECILSLPELADGNSLITITSRGEPNPVGPGSILKSSRPSHPSPEDALINFNVRVQSLQLGTAGHFHLNHTFTFFVHRKSLLEVFESETSTGVAELRVPVPWDRWGPSRTRWFNGDNIPTRWITTTAGQRSALISSRAPQEGSACVVVDFNPHNIRQAKRWLQKKTEEIAQLESQLKALYGLTEDSDTAFEELAAIYDDSIDPLNSSESFQSSSFSSTQSSSPSSNASSAPLPQSLFQEMILLQRRKTIQTELNRIWVVEDRDHLKHTMTFKDAPIGGTLPYVACGSHQKFNWDGVLMDEERLLGISTDFIDRILKVDILHFR